MGEAIEKARAVYAQDFRNKIPKEIVAQHMGYNGLNGASLGVISAVTKYGLLDGGRDSMWVTARAVDIFEREPGDPERLAAISAAASEPDLFRELNESFPGGRASDSALRSFLITKRGFLPDAAMKLIRSYRDTQQVLEREGVAREESAGESPANDSESPIAARPKRDAQMGEAIAPGIVGQGPLATLNWDEAAAVLAPRAAPGEREFIRGPLSRDTSYRLIVTGTVGPREIGKLIKLLEAQRAILEDDPDDLVG